MIDQESNGVAPPLAIERVAGGGFDAIERAGLDVGAARDRRAVEALFHRAVDADNRQAGNELGHDQSLSGERGAGRKLANPDIGKMT